MNATWPVIVLGGSGYVSGELLRLIALHPRLELACAVSTSQAGEAIATSFPHLAPAYPEQTFVSFEAAAAALARAPHWVVLSAAPHGASAALIDQLLTAGEALGVTMTAVDASADFRFGDGELFAQIYGHPHPAPARLGQFRCAVPEHLAELDTPHAAQPGCFATAMLLGIVPLLAADLTEPQFFVSGVTGSTGAGRIPTETTHHPVRHSNLFAYQPLRHRHAPEVQTLARSATGVDIRLSFVPHSGPLARGIHATIFARAKSAFGSAQALEAFKEFYRDAAFVRVQSTPPRVKDVVGSNYASLSVSAERDTVVVCCVIDNLIKGAAGGAMQWVNRLLGLTDTEGLTSTATGWI
jgi:N-acetyl-gamma-glutamyl-phosphate reductase common form